MALPPPGKRREAIASAIGAAFERLFRDHVLPFDSAAASALADLAANRRRIGRPISVFDAQIAAVARSRGARLATRDIEVFEGCGVELFDPWA